MIFNIIKISVMAKGCKFSLSAFNFTGVSNPNGVKATEAGQYRKKIEMHVYSVGYYRRFLNIRTVHHGMADGLERIWKKVVLV
jgi:hypothetical protein